MVLIASLSQMSREEMTFPEASGHSTFHQILSDGSGHLIPLATSFDCSVLLTHQVHIDHRG